MTIRNLNSMPENQSSFSSQQNESLLARVLDPNTAGGMVLGVLGYVLLSNPKLSESFQLAVLVWLAFILLVGYTINDIQGRHLPKLAASAALSCVVMVIAFVVHGLFQPCSFSISGLNFTQDTDLSDACPSQPELMVSMSAILLTVAFLSWAAMIVASRARPLIYGAIVGDPTGTTERLKRLELIVSGLARVVVALIALGAIFL